MRGTKARLFQLVNLRIHGDAGPIRAVIFTLFPAEGRERQMTHDLLSSLQTQVRWNTAFHTFGSNHNTLIGLLVDWWVNCGPHHESIEGAPSFALRSEGGGGVCDAILVEQGLCKGVVEVEGGYVEQGGKEEPLKKYFYALERIGKYFLPHDPDWKALEFGIFLAYPTVRKYMYMPLPIDEFVDRAKELTSNHAGMQLVILTLDKKWDPQTTGIRARKNNSHDYYKGSPFRITGVLVKNGTVQDSRILAGT